MSTSIPRPAVHRPSWPRRCVAVAVAAVGFLLLVAQPAAAHVGDSSSADNFSAAVTSVSPSLPDGISVEVIDFGNLLRVSNTTDEVVEVPGYSAEPYLRIGPDGVQRNENSPATYLNLTRAGTTALPGNADPNAEPSWVTVSDEPVYEWPDHRTHWISAVLPPEVRADPGAAHRVIEWTITLRIGGNPYDVSGVLEWTPPPPTWVPYLILVTLAGLGIFAGWIRRSARLATGLLLLACAGSLWHLASTPLGQGGASSVIYGLLAAAVPTVAVVVVTIFAVRALRRQSGPEPSASAPYLFGIAGWLLIAEALPDLDMLFRANVSAIGPAWGARLAVLLVFGIGIGLAIGSFGLLRSRASFTADQPEEVPSS